MIRIAEEVINKLTPQTVNIRTYKCEKCDYRTDSLWMLESHEYDEHESIEDTPL